MLALDGHPHSLQWRDLIQNSIYLYSLFGESPRGEKTHHTAPMLRRGQGKSAMNMSAFDTNYKTFLQHLLSMLIVE